MGRPKGSKNKPFVDINDQYLKILKLVKIGITIEKACIAEKICRRAFYKKISKEQKQELLFYKRTTIMGYGFHGGFRYEVERQKNIISFYDEEDE